MARDEVHPTIEATVKVEMVTEDADKDYVQKRLDEIRKRVGRVVLKATLIRGDEGAHGK